MSALSVLSPIVPTATGGTVSASAEAAASDGLFAGMVAAVTPSPAATNGDGHASIDLPAAESDAVEAAVSDAGVTVAPAWPPILLIAPAPPPVAPSSDAADASAAGATPPLSSAPSPQIGSAPATPPAASPSAQPAEAAPSLPATSVAPAAPLAAQTPEPLPAAPAPTPQAQGAKAAEPDVSQAPESSALPSFTGQAATVPSADHALGRIATTEASRSTPPTASGADERAGETLASPRSNAVDGTPRPAQPSIQPKTSASDDAAATQPAPASTDAAPAMEADEARPETAAPARPASPASPQITATTTRVASPPVVTASPTPAEPLKAPTETPRVEPAQQPEQSASAIVAAAPRPQMQTPTPTSTPTQSAPAKVADAPEPTASDAEAEAAPTKGQPAPQAAHSPTATQPVAPARNGSSRLEDRPSNAAASGSQTDANAGAKGNALAPPPSPQSPAAAQATTLSAPALSDNVAAKPVAPVEAAPVDASAAPDLAPSQQVLDAQNAAPAGSRDLGLSQLSRATVETTAQLASQILKKLDGRSTRFDMALTPEGLGRVDVSMEIDSEGHLTARLAFDNPAAATELRSRADELRRQLQDAGFQLTPDSLEFSERNPSSGFGGGGAFDRAPDRRAFAGAARVAAEADAVLPPPGAWTSLSLTPDRVDMKV